MKFVILPFSAVGLGGVFRYEGSWYRKTVMGSFPSDHTGNYTGYGFNNRLERNKKLKPEILVAISADSRDIEDRTAIVEEIAL